MTDDDRYFEWLKDTIAPLRPAERRRYISDMIAGWRRYCEVADPAMVEKLTARIAWAEKRIEELEKEFDNENGNT